MIPALLSKGAMDMARFMAPEQTHDPAGDELPHRIGKACQADRLQFVRIEEFCFEMGSRPLHWRRGAKPVRSASPAAMRIVVAGLYAES
jgi:hypothetical protein